MSDRLPMTLKLLPGLRLEGKLRVIEPRQHGWLVAWDAFSKQEKYHVYDRAVLSADKIFEWTGHRLEMYRKVG